MSINYGILTNGRHSLFDPITIGGTTEEFIEIEKPTARVRTIEDDCDLNFLAVTKIEFIEFGE